MKWALILCLVFAAGCAANQPSELRVTRVKLTPKLLSYAVDHVRDVIGQQLPAAPTAVIYAPDQVLACEMTGGEYGKQVRHELFAAGSMDAESGSGAVIRQKYIIAWVIAGGQPQGGYLCVPVSGPERMASMEKMNAFSDALQQPEPPMPAATASNRLYGRRHAAARSF